MDVVEMTPARADQVLRDLIAWHVKDEGAASLALVALDVLSPIEPERMECVRNSKAHRRALAM